MYFGYCPKHIISFKRLRYMVNKSSRASIPGTVPEKANKFASKKIIPGISVAAVLLFLETKENR